MKVIWDFVKLGGCVVTGFIFLSLCFSCSLLMVLVVATAQASVTPDAVPYDLETHYSYEDLANMMYRNNTPRMTQGLHSGFPSADGWNYSGYDYTTNCGDLLYSPLPGMGVVTFNGLDGSSWNNTELRIKGAVGEIRVLHGRYSLVKPGDTVIGGVTPVGYNASIGNSSGCHSHITYAENKSWSPPDGNDNYATIIRNYTNEYDLDDRLVHAIIRQESNYNPNAISPAGAIGLMQIMPITKQQQCPLADLYDPEQNIACGTKHLRWTFDQMNDEGKLGIMAYHSGVTAQKTRGATKLDMIYYQNIMRYYND